MRSCDTRTDSIDETHVQEAAAAQTEGWMPVALLSETLPEDDLGSELLIFLLADPGRAERVQVGERRPSAPHREVSVFGAGDAHAAGHVGGDQTSDLSLQPLW